MARRRSVMSEQLKRQIAQELGIDHIVQQQGFEGVSSRDCGNMVKKAIEIAERQMMAGINQPR